MSDRDGAQENGRNGEKKDVVEVVLPQKPRDVLVRPSEVDDQAEEPRRLQEPCGADQRINAHQTDSLEKGVERKNRDEFDDVRAHVLPPVGCEVEVDAIVGRERDPDSEVQPFDQLVLRVGQLHAVLKDQQYDTEKREEHQKKVVKPLDLLSPDAHVHHAPRSL